MSKCVVFLNYNIVFFKDILPFLEGNILIIIILFGYFDKNKLNLKC